MIPILRTYNTSIWHKIFFFTKFCIALFGMRSLAHTMLFLQSFAYELLAYDLFLYELLLTIFWQTMFCPILLFSYQHLLTAFPRTNFWHTNLSPVAPLIST